MKCIFLKIMKVIAVAATAFILWSLFGPTILDILATPAFVIYAHLVLLGLIAISLLRRNKMNEIYIVRLINILTEINKTLHLIHEGKPPAPKASHVEFFTFNEAGEEQRMERMIVKADSKPKKFRVKYFDANKNPAAVDGMPALTLLNAELGIAKATLNPVEGQVGVYEGELSFLGVVGQTQINVVADALIGEGVEELPAQSELIDVVAAQASIAEIEFLADEVPAAKR